MKIKLIQHSIHLMLYYMPQTPYLPVGEHIMEQPVPALPALAIILPDCWLPLYHVSPLQTGDRMVSSLHSAVSQHLAHIAN